MTEPALIAAMIILLVVTSALFGVTLLLSYVVTRMLSSDGWDDSNVLNAFRLLAHVVLHPEDFKHMFYLNDNEGTTRFAFPYLSQDEFADVVKTRPKPEEKW